MKNLLLGLLVFVSSVSNAQIKDSSIVSRMMNSQITDQSMTLNLGIAASVGSSALTISLKQSDGATAPTVLSPVSIAFRSSTASTGGFSIVKATAATTLVVPSTALLGAANGVDQYLFVYAINNAGTIELAVSGNIPFEDNSIQTSTTITTGADSGGVLYSTTGRSSVAVRLIGRFLINEATAGTWNSTPTDIRLIPRLAKTTTPLTAYTPTIASVGTATNVSFFWKRDGQFLYVTGWFNAGTTTAAVATITLPTGLSMDAAALGTNNILSAAGTLVGMLQSNANGGYTAWVLTAPATSATIVYLAVQNSTASLVPNSSNVNTFILTSAAASVNFRLPILNWYDYGP